MLKSKEKKERSEWIEPEPTHKTAQTTFAPSREGLASTLSTKPHTAVPDHPELRLNKALPYSLVTGAVTYAIQNKKKFHIGTCLPLPDDYGDHLK